jgi:TPR repeat protein
VTRNEAESARWHKLAGEQGSDYSQLQYGLLCLRGGGVPRSQAAAIVWLRMAAAQGNALAREELASLGVK